MTDQQIAASLSYAQKRVMVESRQGFELEGRWPTFDYYPDEPLVTSEGRGINVSTFKVLVEKALLTFITLAGTRREVYTITPLGRRVAEIVKGNQ